MPIFSTAFDGDLKTEIIYNQYIRIANYFILNLRINIVEGYISALCSATPLPWMSDAASGASALYTSTHLVTCCSSTYVANVRFLVKYEAYLPYFLSYYDRTLILVRSY